MVNHLSLPGIVSYAGSREPIVVVSAVLGAALWVTRLRPPGAAAASVRGAVCLAVGFPPLTAWMAEGLPRRDPVADADAVFVSASNLQRDGDPTPTSLARLLRGLELVA